MTTPLDVLFLDHDNRPEDGAVPQFVLSEMAAYSDYLDSVIPPKRLVGRNLLIATWNACHFNSLTKMWSVPRTTSISPNAIIAAFGQ